MQKHLILKRMVSNATKREAKKVSISIGNAREFMSKLIEENAEWMSDYPGEKSLGQVIDAYSTPLALKLKRKKARLERKAKK